MSSLDDIFREGLGGRRAEVPKGMWDKISAAKSPTPTGEAIDHYFADKLRDRRAPVPAGMWNRIVATRSRGGTTRYWRYVAAGLLLLLAAFGGWRLANGDDTKVTSEDSELALTLPPDAEETVKLSFPPPPAQRKGQVLPTENDGKKVTSVTSIPSNAASLQESRVPSRAGDARQTSAYSTDVILEEEIPVPSDGKERNVKTTAFLPTLPIAALDLPPTEPTVSSRYRPRASNKDPFRASGRNRVQSEILFGPAYAERTFGLQSEDARPLKELREVSEAFGVSYQFSARIRYHLTQRVRLLAGLNYVEIRNRFDYPLSFNGPPLQPSNNRIRMLEMPLLAGYELPGRRLRLNINAGAIVNLSTGVNGRFLDPNASAPLDLRTDGNYRNNIGVGWTASLTTTYYLGKERTFQLLLEPFFKSYTGSFTRSDAALSEKYWVAGLQLGLRKQLQ